tara:strand:- start:18136 stop:19251 length:1116 start_codon:yes stop_codon:yes gene_type:complete
MTVSAATTGSATLTWDGSAFSSSISYTVPSGADALVLVITSDWFTFASIEYNSVALSLQAQRDDENASKVHIYDLLAPTVGANNLVLEYGGAEVTVNYAIYTISGLDETTPRGTPYTHTTFATSVSNDFTTVAGDIVIDVLNIADTSTATMGADQTSGMIGGAARAGYFAYSSSEEATTTTTTMSWAIAAASTFAYVAVLYNLATNTAPVIDTPESDIVESAGTAWTRDISDNSSDEDLDTLTYSVSPALPAGITLNTTTGVITATTSTVAQLPTNYTFTHSDGTDSVDDIVSIHITGILSVGGDNEMDNNETDVLIATTGLPASVTTFTSVKVDSVVMDNIRWNSGQPLFDAPSGMALGSALTVEVEFTE